MSRAPSWFAAKHGRRDPEHAAIGKALSSLGHFCIDLAAVGDGVLDWLVFPCTPALRAWEPLAHPVAFVEVKAKKGKLRKSQALFIEKLKARGIRHVVARTVAQAVAAFR